MLLFKYLLLFLGIAYCKRTLHDTPEPLADALHAVSSSCIARDSHNACHEFSKEQLSQCSAMDLNCQCAKMAEIHDYCHKVCHNSDYVSDALRSFLDGVCSGEQRLLKRDVPDDSAVAANETPAETRIAEGLGQLIDSAKSKVAPIVDDHLKPAYAKVKETLETKLSATKGHANSTEHGAEHGAEQDPETRKSQALTSVPQSSVHPETSSRIVKPTPTNAQPRSSNTTSTASKTSSPEWVNTKRTNDKRELVTMYVDVPVPSTAVETVATRPTVPSVVPTPVLDRLRNRLNINAVQKPSNETAQGSSAAESANTFLNAAPTLGSSFVLEIVLIAVWAILF